MNVSATARKIYRAIKDSAPACAQYRAEFLTLALALGVDPDSAFELTSSTTNGQTFSGRRSSSEEERFTLVSEVVWMLDNEQRTQSTSRVLF